MMLARRVQEIMMVLQQFIPAVIERMTELEAAVGSAPAEGETVEAVEPTETGMAPEEEAEV
jgi:hypothetical protein